MEAAMRFRFVIVMMIAGALFVLAGAHGRAELVPCGVTMPDAKDGCGKPFVEGVVDHQWVGLIAHYTGGNGGVDALYPFTVGRGGNGLRTITLPAIKTEGEYGDRMYAWFANDKLYVVNAIYLPGEAHCCFTHNSVRQYGFDERGLVRERTTTVATTATRAQIYAALAKAPAF